MARRRADVDPEPAQIRAEVGPHQGCVRPETGPHSGRRTVSRRQIDDFSREIIARLVGGGLETRPMPTPQPLPVRLTPRRPPGRSDRKALRYVCDVRRLRAEGYSLESIRLALLDAGVSVSLSTVRREVARTPSQWELDREQGAEVFLEQLKLTNGALHMSPSPQLLNANSGQPPGPTSDKPGRAQIEAVNDLKPIGVLRKLSGALRGLWRTRRTP